MTSTLALDLKLGLRMLRNFVESIATSERAA